jgi:hypothetical protein
LAGFWGGGGNPRRGGEIVRRPLKDFLRL